eukprot:TRINITY_DN819_c5_g1_i1.p1 TRINITY_DN819_c5_g1~~TRINITY_DN819_c5_g1_i1.p1  ORF type:complete len:639 (+),score=134.93 TRINITY_DN819_c5_g1_i1:85-2001(+)
MELAEKVCLEASAPLSPAGRPSTPDSSSSSFLQCMLKRSTIRVGDVVRERRKERHGIVRRLVEDSEEALVSFGSPSPSSPSSPISPAVPEEAAAIPDSDVPSKAPQHPSSANAADDNAAEPVPLGALRVVARDGLWVGQRVAWCFEDPDLPRGSVGILQAFREGDVTVATFRGKRYGFSMDELLDATPHEGLGPGDRVRRRAGTADRDLFPTEDTAQAANEADRNDASELHRPEGSTGLLLGFGCRSGLAVVEYERQVETMAASELEVVEYQRPLSRSSSSSAPEPDALDASMRPPCYPFDGREVLEFDGGHVVLALRDASAPIRGLVVFCPGTHGGVGPCRTPGTNHDPNALFPTLARELESVGVSSCRVCWSAMHPPLGEAMRGVLLAVHLALRRAIDADPSLVGDGAAAGDREGGARAAGARRLGICLVGHSLGGAVVLAAARLLLRLLPELREKMGGVSVDLLGVCTLAAQERGGIEAAAALGSIRKLFLHGSADAVLPYQVAERLHEAAPPPKEMAILPDGEHDFFTYKAHVLSRVRGFIADTLELGSNIEPLQRQSLQPRRRQKSHRQRRQPQQPQQPQQQQQQSMETNYTQRGWQEDWAHSHEARAKVQAVGGGGRKARAPRVWRVKAAVA